MSCPLISVLIPAFNVQDYIEESVQSILEQTHKNLEIIVVDDASTDNTWVKLQELAASDARIRLLRNEQNSKIVFSLNRALSVATGQYIARMDGDDVAHPERIERQLAYLESHDDVDLVGVSTIAIDAQGQELSRQPFICDPKLIDLCLNLTSLVSHNWLCHRKVYEQLQGYRELAPVEDYDFLLRMKTSGFRFINIPFYGMKIRYRDGNTATTAGVEQIKAFNYVTRLYRMRISMGKDDFSYEKFKGYVRAGTLVRRLHAFSVKCLYRAFAARKAGNRLAVAFLGGLALLSPFQLQTVFRRRLMHFYMRGVHK